MECKTVKNQLSDYIDGQLPEAAAAGISNHLESCPDCRQAHEELRRLVGWMREMDTVDEPADLVENVRRRLERPSRWERLGRWFSAPTVRAPATAAALVAILLLVLYVPGERELTPEGFVPDRADERAAAELARPEPPGKPQAEAGTVEKDELDVAGTSAGEKKGSGRRQLDVGVEEPAPAAGEAALEHARGGREEEVSTTEGIPGPATGGAGRETERVAPVTREQVTRHTGELDTAGGGATPTEAPPTTASKGVAAPPAEPASDRPAEASTTWSGVAPEVRTKAAPESVFGAPAETARATVSAKDTVVVTFKADEDIAAGARQAAPRGTARVLGEEGRRDFEADKPSPQQVFVTLAADSAGGEVVDWRYDSARDEDAAIVRVPFDRYDAFLETLGEVGEVVSAMRPQPAEPESLITIRVRILR